MEKYALCPLIVIIMSILIRFLIFCFTMSFLDHFRKYGRNYDEACLGLEDTVCQLTTKASGSLSTKGGCSTFNFGDKKSTDINHNDLKFPVSPFNEGLVWLGAAFYIVLFLWRVFYDVVWITRRLSSSKFERLEKLDNMRGIVSYWYFVLDAFVIMWMFPLFLYHFQEDCLKSLYEYDDYKDDNQNSTGYTFSLFIFSILILPVALFGYRYFRAEDKWMRITLGLCWLYNFIFVAVSTHRSFTAIYKEFQAFAILLICMWLTYLTEILMFWVKYYDNNPGGISSIGGIVRNLGKNQMPKKDDSASAENQA